MRITEPAVDEAPVEVVAVVAAEVAGPHQLSILFADGERRAVDFGPFLRRTSHPALQSYLDEARFRQFAIRNGNVNWNDYDLIFPVADLYAGTIRF